MSLLNKLAKTKTKSSKRPGRGYGSGRGGHTSGRGMKGQNSREGNGAPLWFEGGQLPQTKRYPMIRGKGRFKVLNQPAEITLTELNKLSVKEVTLETLKLHRVIERGFKRAKIINTGELTKKINVKGIPVTVSARKTIEKLGGSVA